MLPEMDRRQTFGVVAAGVAAAVLPYAAKAQIPAFTLPPLVYPHDALLPVIDAETMMLHHEKHHAAYVKVLNEAVAARPDTQGLSVEAIMGRISTLPEAFRQGAGQHYAHSLLWSSMAAAGQRSAPSPELLAAMDRDLGGFDRMKADFAKAGAKQFGSGWAWLILTPGGKLAITSTGNADTPLMDDAKVKGAPLLVNDVWEHAYYLTHRNRRAAYLAQWWSVVNWGLTNERYEEAVAKRA